MKDQDLTVAFGGFRNKFTHIQEQGVSRSALPLIKDLTVDIRNHLEAILDSSLIEENPKQVLVYMEIIKGYQSLLECLKTLEKSCSAL